VEGEAAATSAVRGAGEAAELGGAENVKLAAPGFPITDLDRARAEVFAGSRTQERSPSLFARFRERRAESANLKADAKAGEISDARRAVIEMRRQARKAGVSVEDWGEFLGIRPIRGYSALNDYAEALQRTRGVSVQWKPQEATAAYSQMMDTVYVSDEAMSRAAPTEAEAHEAGHAHNAHDPSEARLRGVTQGSVPKSSGHGYGRFLGDDELRRYATQTIASIGELVRGLRAGGEVSRFLPQHLEHIASTARKVAESVAETKRQALAALRAGASLETTTVRNNVRMAGRLQSVEEVCASTAWRQEGLSSDTSHTISLSSEVVGPGDPNRPAGTIGLSLFHPVQAAPATAAQRAQAEQQLTEGVAWAESTAQAFARIEQLARYPRAEDADDLMTARSALNHTVRQLGGPEAALAPEPIVIDPSTAEPTSEAAGPALATAQSPGRSRWARLEGTDAARVDAEWGVQIKNEALTNGRSAGVEFSAPGGSGADAGGGVRVRFYPERAELQIDYVAAGDDVPATLDSHGAGRIATTNYFVQRAFQALGVDLSQVRRLKLSKVYHLGDVLAHHDGVDPMRLPFVRNVGRAMRDAGLEIRSAVVSKEIPDTPIRDLPSLVETVRSRGQSWPSSNDAALGEKYRILKGRDPDELVAVGFDIDLELAPLERRPQS
jgi:hypothetical protein